MARQKLDNLLFEVLSDGVPRTRENLVSITAKPRTTVYDNLKKLLLKDKVKKKSKKLKKHNNRGRPEVFWSVKLVN